MQYLLSRYFLSFTYFCYSLFHPIQDGGGGAKRHPPSTSFSSVTSGNVGINPKNFLTLRVNPFATLV